MKPSRLLVVELRSLFGLIRGLMLIWLVVLPILFVAHRPTSPHWAPRFGRADFNPNTIAVRTGPGPRAGVTEGIRLQELTGSLSVADAGTGAALIAATRVPVFVANLTRTLILFAIAHLLWRLCQNVERGEVFSSSNFQLVRGLGVTLVAGPVVGAIAETWRTASITRFVEDHVTFEGLQPIFSSSGLGWWDRAVENTTRFSDFDFSLFVTGLLVLVLAEVFRRGLALKQENDLTV